MESFLKVPVQSAVPHALPFRVFLEEYRRRRSGELLHNAKAVFGMCPTRSDADAAIRLRGALTAQEEAYCRLKEASYQLAAGKYKRVLDPLVSACQDADKPLKELLHRMNVSAVCLSGGGIRSASFSLGILEGLARFSANGKNAYATKDSTGKDGTLMSSLDCLSTVSGGGYMGSWMMSWVYRRMDVCGNVVPLHAMLTSAKNLLRLLESCKRLELATEEEVQRQIDALGQNYSEVKTHLDELDARHADWRSEPRKSGGPLATEIEAVLDDLGVKLQNVQEHRKSLEPHLARCAGGKTDRTLTLAESVDAKRTCSALVADLTSIQCALEGILGRLASSAYRDVLHGLAGRMPVTGGDPEPQSVRHLRSYTSYLAPDLGLTLDTFTLAAIMLRNFIVNWLMLVPVLIALIAAVAGSAALLLWLRASGLLVRPLPVVGLLNWKHLLLTVLFAMAAGFAIKGIPSVAEHKARDHARAPDLRRQKLCTYLFLIFTLMGGWLFTVVGAEEPTLRNFYALTVLAGLGFGLLSWATYRTYKRRAEMGLFGVSRGKWTVRSGLALATLFMAFVTGGLLFVLQDKWLHQLGHGYVLCRDMAAGRLFAVFAFPLVLGSLMLCATVYCALIGLLEGEDDREWWARCQGFLLSVALAWTAVHAVVLYGDQGAVNAWSAISGAALAWVTSLMGKSGNTRASQSSGNLGELSGFWKFLERHHLVLPVVGGVAILLMVLGMVWVETRLQEQVKYALHLSQGSVWDDLFGSLVLCLVAAAVGIGFNFAININLFSLHGMYRMRLMRAFLGASNVFRHPDLFTDFDRKDTPHEALMPCFEGAPMHLLNATLNLTGTKNTAWRQRKAEGFSFSPVVCGGWRIGFVPTSMYAGSKGLGNRNNGLTLATAMAISGAAANPNMGYQSSPVLSLLMTFFNLRLGCWLPNPARPESRSRFGSSGEAFFRRSGPTFALWPLFAEALELTDDKYRWVELTDGGHFEDLALYEMVLRRVKLLIVVDGGADPKFGFEDLGNAIRKIQIDLGIPIEFGPDLKMQSGPCKTNRYCAVARVRYSCADPVTADEDGWLVYIKASMTGEEPADILQYARTHESFPHESTGDQFFTESQFESYRHLGSHMINTIVPGLDGNSSKATRKGSFADFITAAIAYSGYTG